MGKTAYLFPGQGSQCVGMGLDLYEKYDSAKKIFHKADEVLGFSISKLCFEGPEEELTKTLNAQPALLVTSLACLAAAKEELSEQLPKADYMAGHSLGEYSALAASGSLDFESAVKLARLRGQFMYDAGQKVPGTMAAVIGMSREQLEEICVETGIYIANYNCPGQIVISGEKETMKTAKKMARERGAKMVLPLQVSGAFHSPLVQEAADRLKPELKQSRISTPDTPVIANGTVQILDSSDMVCEELIFQVCHSVRWEETIRLLLSQGVTTFIEFGPGNVLTGLLKRINAEVEGINIGSCQDIDGLCQKGGGID